MESYLKYGALGIILALAILVYRLIANEQKKEQPRKQMIFAIAIFMTFALIAMVIAIPAELIQKQENFGAIFNSNTKADQTAYTWQHYNHPFGYNIDLPDFIKEGDLSSGVQQYVSNYNKLLFTIDKTMSDIVTNSDELRKYYESKLLDNNFTYKFFKENSYFVVTGKKADGTLYYFKGLLKNNSFYRMDIEFPESYLSRMEKPLTRISLSFK